MGAGDKVREIGPCNRGRGWRQPLGGSSHSSPGPSGQECVERPPGVGRGEVAVPHRSVGNWPGSAYKPADCGAEVTLYLRAKLGS